MLLGGFSNFLTFANPIFFDKSKELRLKNMVLDCIKIDESLVEFLEEKSEWGYDTVLLGEFDSTLEAGNVLNGGLQIEYLKLKKRKKDDLIWQDIKIFTYDTNIKRYSYEDRLVESYDTYEYAVQPITSEILGTENIEEIDVKFDGIWLLGEKNDYQLVYDTEINEFRSNISQNVVTTLGNRYPFLIRNGNVNYKEFTVKGRIVTKSSAESSRPDFKSEKKLRKALMSFLEDGKPKLIKDNSGNYVLCQISGTPTYTPVNTLDRGIYDVEFSVVEIGDAYDNETLLQYGLINNENLLTGEE